MPLAAEALGTALLAATAVGSGITAACWFTSFANPAVARARAFTTSFAGTRRTDASMSALFQIIGALAGLLVAGSIFERQSKR